MSNPDKSEEHPIPATSYDEHLTSSSILDWIQEINTSTPTLSTSPYSICSQLRELSPSRHTKRRSSSRSLPSVFLGDRPTVRKRRRLSYAIAGNISPPSTPFGRNSSTTSGEPHTPAPNGTPGASVEALKPSKTAKAVGQILEEIGLHKDDRVAFDSYPQFKAKVIAIIASDRGSTMKPESHKKFQAYLDWHEYSNESTFVRKIFPLLMKDGYHLTKEKGSLDGETGVFETREYSEYRDFLMDEGIVDTSDREFLKTLVPSTCNKDNEVKISKLLAKVAGMTNPKPDYAFGVRWDRFPIINDVTVPDHIKALLGIAPELYHTFLIVEGKQDTGSQAEAENQARRGGATLVHGERLLRQSVEAVADIVGPDEESFVFSVTLTPKMAEFWVHWYEGKGPGHFGKYHMNSVGSRFLKEEYMREDVRRRMHNIMEWGGINGLRHQEMLKLHESIHGFAQAEQTRKLAGKASARKRPRTESSSNQEEEAEGESSRGQS